MSFFGVTPATDEEHEAAIAVLEEAGAGDQRWVVDEVARIGWDAETLMVVARGQAGRARRRQEART